MKKIISIILTLLMLMSMASVSFVTTKAATTDRLPFSSTATTSQSLKGFIPYSGSSTKYYKLDGSGYVTYTALKESTFSSDYRYPYVTQGATAFGGAYYFAATYNNANALTPYNYSGGYIVKYVINEKKYYISDRIPIGHANDFCYDPDRNWLLCANNAPNAQIITIIEPDTLTCIGQIDVGSDIGGIFGIEYNAKTKQYIIFCSGEDTLNYIITINDNLEFSVVKSYQREDPNLNPSKSPCYLKQGAYATPDYIMYAYSHTPTGSGKNIIRVTDWEGNFIQDITDPHQKEIEDIMVDDDGYIYFVYHDNSARGSAYLAKMTAWTIKYLPNGGEGTMADSEHYYGTSKEISANAFTREGYTFAGWKISRKSDGKHLYTNNNNDTNEWYIPGTQPAGWRKSVYENKRKVSALAHDIFDEVYLEAQWTPKATGKQTYYIEYDPNGGTGTMPMTTCIWGESNVLPENTITREDYKFLGWSARRRSTDYWGFVTVSTGADNWRSWTTSSSYTLKLYQPGQTISKTSNVDRDIVEFMCQWEYIPNSILQFNANGGTGTMDNYKLVHGETVAMPVNTFTKKGYEFVGWYAQKQDGTYLTPSFTWSATGEKHLFTDGQDIANVGDGTGDKINMIAQWEVIPNYTVKFDSNGGTGEMADMSLKAGVSANLTANAFTKTGYTFAGWTANGKTYADGAQVKDLAEAGETVTLTAQWTANAYTIKFNANGGTGEMADMSMTYDKATNLTANAFTKTGYTFAGWTDGSNTYADKAEVKNLTATDGDTITLTAQWKLYGDINSDGKVNVRDATYIQMYLVGIGEYTEEQLAMADVDGNGKLTVRDVTYIQMHVALILDVFPVCNK